MSIVPNVSPAGFKAEITTCWTLSPAWPAGLQVWGLYIQCSVYVPACLYGLPQEYHVGLKNFHHHGSMAAPPAPRHTLIPLVSGSRPKNGNETTSIAQRAHTLTQWYDKQQINTPSAPANTSPLLFCSCRGRRRHTDDWTGVLAWHGTGGLFPFRVKGA